MSNWSIGNVTRTASRRMPWQVASTVFEWLDIQPGRGWDGTVAKLGGAKGYEDEAGRLFEAFRQHIVAGEKSVRFYRTSIKTNRQVRQWLLDAKNSLKDASKYYFRDEADISGKGKQAPKLIAVETYETGVAGIYESIRVTETRQHIDPETVTVLGGGELQGFQDIIGIKLDTKQYFDVLWVPHDGSQLDLRIDSPVGTTIEVESAAHLALKKVIIKSIGNDIFKKQINLFPLIDSIYKNQKEGIISELSFITSTGSVKNERMRRGNVCLRKEIYHKAGSEALKGEIEPFRLSVRWILTNRNLTGSTPEVNFKGSTRLLHMITPALYEIDIRGCTGIVDFEYVRERIIHYLSK